MRALPIFCHHPPLPLDLHLLHCPYTPRLLQLTNPPPPCRRELEPHPVTDVTAARAWSARFVHPSPPSLAFVSLLFVVCLLCRPRLPRLRPVRRIAHGRAELRQLERVGAGDAQTSIGAAILGRVGQRGKHAGAHTCIHGMLPYAPHI